MANGLALAQSCTGGTSQNTSNSSTSALNDAADNQCLINKGTISVPNGANSAFDLSYNNTTVTNSGTINVDTGGSANVVYTYSGSGANITNSGAINVTGNSTSYAIWNVTSPNINSIVNSGNISMTNTGQSVAIFNYTGTITTLTNSGNISISGDYGAIANSSNITTLNNSGSIVSSGNANGIVNNSGHSIGTINNTGSISVPTAGYYGILNNSGATIGALNNSQGAGNTSGALTYTGALPTNYNIIINSPMSYGKLAVTSGTGTTTFGIYTGSILRNGTYASVLSGVTSSNLNNTTGTFGSATWLLSNSSPNIWDLIISGYYTGPSVANTNQSLVNTASALQGTYTLQNSVIANSFAYDCTVFGANNVCVSAGGRNTQVQAANGLNNTSALLIAAYRLNQNYRIGAYADQNLSVSNPGGTVNLGNNTPLLGLFAAWNERLDGTGTEVKVSAAYGQKNTTITRSVVGSGDGASEAGSGSSKLNSQGAQVTAKYGFGIMDNVIVSPYVGVRYTQNNMGGYTESTSSSVTAPLTYSALNTNATTALAGVGASYRVIPTVTTFASAGVETDTNTANGTYAATNASIGTLTPVNFNANPVRTRPTATLGAYYDVAKNQRLGVTGIYRQEAYQAVSTTTVMATYTIGL
ncbi:autotransporter domain-containing protein [Polynucleobacter paneuropaeus]|nr:autotransporter domain-containing protein [Polynucleobacter paneuropaeus]MBT8626620.1 autotransporter domain-containing protein [Polynucleobacter paneuropaeus]